MSQTYWHENLAGGQTARSAAVTFNLIATFEKFETFQGHIIAVFKLQAVLLMYCRISRAM